MRVCCRPLRGAIALAVRPFAKYLNLLGDDDKLQRQPNAQRPVIPSERWPPGRSPALAARPCGCRSGFAGLQAPQRGVLAALGQQLGVRAGFDDAPLIEDMDDVGASHGRQAVGDDQAGAADHQTSE